MAEVANDFSISPVTLAFRDRSLENEFQKNFVTESLGHYRIVAIAGLILWLAVVPLDTHLGGNAVNAKLMTTFRLAAFPFLLACVALGFSSQKRLVRFSQPLTSLSLGALLFSIVGMIAFAPFPELHDSAQTSAGFAVVIVTGYAAVPLRVIYAAIPSLLSSFTLVIVLIVRTDHALVTSMWLLIANAVGPISSYMLERSRRKNFLFSRMLKQEQEKSDALLHTLLPQEIVQRLKNEPGRIADYHEKVTVLFADIVGFTPLAGRLPPKELISILDDIFSSFDEGVARYGLEKIKTIGDAYMVAAGAPTSYPNQTHAMARFALEMRDWVDSYRCPNGEQLQLRIGIHQGPIVAGVIGKDKAVYDLWGDTVNIASRMESHSIPGKILVTQNVANTLKEDFQLGPPLTLNIKGKGEMDTFALLGPTSDSMG